MEVKKCWLNFEVKHTILLDQQFTCAKFIFKFC